MRLMFVALLLLLAGCADTGDEPVQETEDPVSADDPEATLDAGNETDEPVAADNAAADPGNTTTPENGTAEGNTTEPADNGTADGNATEALAPWEGSCRLTAGGAAVSGNGLSIRGDWVCSTDGPGGAYTTLEATSTGEGTWAQAAGDMVIKDAAGTTILSFAVDGSVNGSGSATVSGADLSSLSVEWVDTMAVGDGAATLSFTLS